MPHFTLGVRKGLLMFSRIQSLPIVGSPFADQLGAVLHEDVVLHSSKDSERPFLCSFKEIIDGLHPHCTPFVYSLISLCSRMAPFTDYTEMLETLESSIEKEVEASVNITNRPPLNFSVFLGDTPYNWSQPFTEQLGSDERVSFSIYLNFCSAAEKLRGITLWPDIGEKTVGEEVARNFYTVYQELNLDWKSSSEVTTADLERLYKETGIEVLGPVEMRWSWKYSQIKPRIYFARGGPSFYRSRYIQQIFNIILDEFPEVHRQDRFLEPYYRLGTQDTAVIYDFISFTSALEAVKEFIENLAVFFDDVPVVIVDSYHGFVHTTVGNLLHEYNNTCNNFMEFSTEKVILDPTMHRLFHTCGMLGVPGNISSCTLLHGILDRYIAGEHRSKSVGDDGKIYTDLGSDPEQGIRRLFLALGHIGDIQPSKMFAFRYFDIAQEPIEHHTYQFIKRPYFRLENTMHSGNLFILPLPAYVMRMGDPYHDPSFEDRLVDCQKFQKSLHRFLIRFSRESHTQWDIDEAMIRRYVAATAKLVKKTLSRQEAKKERLFMRCFSMPPDDFRYMTRGELIVQSYEMDEELTLPATEVEQFGLGTVGEEWILPSSKEFQWLSKMKMVTSPKLITIKCTRRVFGDDYLKDLLDNHFTKYYSFSIRYEVPWWLMSLLDTRYH